MRVEPAPSAVRRWQANDFLSFLADRRRYPFRTSALPSTLSLRDRYCGGNRPSQGRELCGGYPFWVLCGRWSYCELRRLLGD